MGEYADLQLWNEPKNLRISDLRTIKKLDHLVGILRTRSALEVDRHVSNLRF
jgi:hypothetical protein